MTTPATASAAILLWPRFIDHESTTKELLSIEGRDHFFRFGIIANLGKAEPARLAGEAVAKQSQRIRLDTYFSK